MTVVTLEDFTPGPRYDSTAWTQARIEEAAAATGPWTALETRNLVPVDSDPTAPRSRDFTTELATRSEGWYRIVWIDPTGDTQPSPPTFSGPEAQAYASITSVRKILTPYGDPDPSTGTAAGLPNEQIQQAIEQAFDEINGVVAARYSLPFSEPIPPLLESLNRDIAAYLATLTYRKNEPLSADDPVRLRYDRAEKLLLGIQSGAIEIVGAAEDVIEQEGEPAAVVNAYEGDLFTLTDFGLGLGMVTDRWAPP